MKQSVESVVPYVPSYVASLGLFLSSTLEFLDAHAQGIGAVLAIITFGVNLAYMHKKSKRLDKKS